MAQVVAQRPCKPCGEVRFLLGAYVLRGIGLLAWASAFQADEASSILASRSRSARASFNG